ncbi:hypothetical protein [Nocardia sp. NPDC005978]|uniref:hypothetical protein n=1 Tax=unclassified Nocardia TaxID=2637762 RepID=UPI0033B1A593
MSGLRCGAAVVVAGCAFVLSGCEQEVTEKLKFGESVTVSLIDGTVGIAVLSIERGTTSDLDGLVYTMSNSPVTSGTPYYVRYRLTRTSAGADVGTHFVVEAGRNRLGEVTINPPLYSGFGTQSGVEKECPAVRPDEFRALSQGQSLEGCKAFVAPSAFGGEAPTRVQWVPYEGRVVAIWGPRA